MSLAEEVIDFLSETREYLESADPLVIQLRSGDTPPKNAVDNLFRLFHSIKGVSGFLGFGNVQKVTHGIEEILDLVRTGHAELSDQIVEILLAGCDFLRSILSIIEQNGNDQTDLSSFSPLLDSIHQLLESKKKQNNVLDLQLNGAIFPCFSTPEFLAAFQENLRQTTGSAENELFKFFDNPENRVGIFDNVEGHLSTLVTNLKFIDKAPTIELIQTFMASLQMAKKRDHVESETLGNWFGALGWIDENAMRDHQSADAEASLNQLISTLKTDTAKESKAAEAASTPTTPAVAASTPAKAEENTTSVNARGEIRVEMEKMDRLVELIEELSVVTGVVARESTITNNDDPKFLQATNKLQQITASLQDVAMSVRLIPMSTTTKKLTRLVYDVSRKLGKEVEFIIRGEKTELDRNMVEALQDPLVHIFRNAIDHGLETKAERIEAGKSDGAAVTFEAWLGGGEVFIAISDNGRGMSPARIFDKAVEKGIVDPAVALSDRDILQLIFEPGFSTRTEVTDFSGRGVGMDVVRQSIQSLGGNIEIESEVNVGSKFILSLPLISTIVETLLVKVGDVRYSIRVASVRELFSCTNDEIINSPDGMEHVRLRDKIYPILRIGQIQKASGREPIRNAEDGILILVENKGAFAVLLVDEIIGTNQGVIKSLPSYMKHIQGISGCSVIGTNSDDISWTLDINNLMSHSLEESNK